ncbi:hypothetical protein M432DRAFT_643069 [Thermoascus aurantiacus ATCC 26904]
MSHHGGQDRRITGFNTIILQDLARGIRASPGQLGGLFRFSAFRSCSTAARVKKLGRLAMAVAHSAGAPFTRENNVLAALAERVERGVPLETIAGTKFVDDTSALGVEGG